MICLPCARCLACRAREAEAGTLWCFIFSEKASKRHLRNYTPGLTRTPGPASLHIGLSSPDQSAGEKQSGIYTRRVLRWSLSFESRTCYAVFFPSRKRVRHTSATTLLNSQEARGQHRCTSGSVARINQKARNRVVYIHVVFCGGHCPLSRIHVTVRIRSYLPAHQW